MSKTIYNADYSECLPEALKKDPKMVALANATAATLLDTSGIIDNVLIYSRFDELPEELVDILAYDLHVDWYDYNYPLEAKRDLVKNSVKVHKKMGTKYAIETALGSLFPESEVEEWFQYEGEPGHFHIVLDVTNQRITADYAAIIRAVKMYKRLSAHMDELTYQGQVHGVIYTHGEYFRYKTPLTGRLNAGTYPQRNTKSWDRRCNLYCGNGSSRLHIHGTSSRHKAIQKHGIFTAGGAYRRRHGVEYVWLYKYTSRTDKSRRAATEEHQRADKRRHSHGK